MTEDRDPALPPEKVASPEKVMPAEKSRAELLAEQVTAAPTRSVEEHRRASRRSFLTGGLAAVAAVAGFRSLQRRPEIDNVPDVLRKGYELNENVWRALSTDGQSPTYSPSDRGDLRVNGRIGVRDEIDLEAWTLTIIGPDGERLDELAIDDIKALGEESIIWEHKCIEGWSQIVGWTGARFADLAARYDVEFDYVSLKTPDESYYVGLDREAALHDQTLLAWALNDEPLTQLHGAPLRLATPVKYGIKQLKRIGTIEFTNERPADYWAERGYSWYSGL